MLRLFNTLSRTKDEFEPIDDNEVRLYSCGPTVYNYAHIGNLSMYLIVDLLKRYLKYRKYAVRHIMNITDIDDKTIKASQREGVPLKELAQRYTDAFMADLDALNIQPATDYTPATEHIDEMVALIEKLIEKGHAYESDGSVYFKISSFDDYGKFARIDMTGLQDGVRVDNDEYAKESARDFALWKAWTDEDGDVYWESPWGRGRPGWHIECSAMAMKYLGETFDIHTGGVDHIFPHHQNEIAQSEGASGKRFANYWLHREFLNVSGSKMAKSSGNIFTLSEIGKTAADIKAFRYLVVVTHYRTALNFTEDVLDSAKTAMRRLNNLRERLKSISLTGESVSVTEAIDQTRERFIKHMDDDLNAARAIADMFDLVRQIDGWLNDDALNHETAGQLDAFFDELNEVLGIFYTLPDEEEEQSLPDDVMALIKEREEARRSKDWQMADELRDKLLEHGVVIKDTPSGTEWEMKSG